MRKLKIFLHMSLDGIVEGPKGPMDIGFVAYNEELEAFAQKNLASVDTILWGRATYEMMADYWPKMLDNPDATDYERRHARWIQDVEKIVASKTLKELDWNHSTLIQENLEADIQKLRNKEGKDILVLGSPRLANYLLQAKLVDGIIVTLSPTLVGNGYRLFDQVTADMELMSSESFSTGALGLTYQVKNQ